MNDYAALNFCLNNYQIVFVILLYYNWRSYYLFI